MSLGGLTTLSDATVAALTKHFDVAELIADGRIELTSMKALKLLFPNLDSLLARSGHDFDDEEVDDEENDEDGFDDEENS